MQISGRINAFFWLLMVFTISSCVGCGGLMGGLSCWKEDMTDEAGTEAKQIANAMNLRSQIEAGLSGGVSVFEPVAYKSQVVAGTNYFIKIKVEENPDKFIVAKVYKPLPYMNQPPSLTYATDYTDFVQRERSGRA